jgi:UDP:flavonoid glycosyltransferase YjiC (YdhE family)
VAEPGRKTVLFAWELGGNLGHLMPIAPLVRALSDKGTRVVVAARDLAYAGLALDPGIGLLQAPAWPQHRHFGLASGLVASHADILTAVGFADAEKLAVMVRAWRQLIDLVRPDAIVADHSPALMVAMRGQGIPMIAAGACFTTPPLDYARFPPLRSDAAPSLPEERLLESVDAVLDPATSRPERLVEVFRTGYRVVLGLPELDPYGAFRREELFAPAGGLPPAQGWPAERRLFVYLGAEAPNLEALAQALGTLKSEAEIYLRGELGPLRRFLKRRGHQVHDRPPPLAEVLGRVSHVFTQGGAMTAAAALTAGRPQLVMPLHEEAWLNYRMLERLRIAWLMRTDLDEEGVGRLLARFLADPNVLANARDQAAITGFRGQRDAGAVLEELIEAALA